MGPISKIRAFTLAEVAVVMPIFLVLMSMSFMSGTSIINKFTDPRSDYRVDMEIDMTVDWLESVMRRAMQSKADFTLRIFNESGAARLKVMWKNTDEFDEWRARGVRYESSSANFAYSARFQTFSPAVTFLVRYSDGKNEFTGRIITISGYGLIRSRKAA